MHTHLRLGTFEWGERLCQRGRAGVSGSPEERPKSHNPSLPAKVVRNEPVVQGVDASVDGSDLGGAAQTGTVSFVI